MFRRNYLESGFSESRGDIRSVTEAVHENMKAREMCRDNNVVFVVT